MRRPASSMDSGDEDLGPRGIAHPDLDQDYDLGVRGILVADLHDDDDLGDRGVAIVATPTPAKLPRRRGRQPCQGLALRRPSAGAPDMCMLQAARSDCGVILAHAYGREEPVRHPAQKRHLDTVIASTLGANRRQCLSRAGEAFALGIDRRKLASYVEDVAAGTFAADRSSVDVALSRLVKDASEGAVEINCVVTQTVNDETSVLLRLPQEVEEKSGVAQGEPIAPPSIAKESSTAQVVRLMQSEANLAVLLTSTTNQHKHLLKFRIPAPVRGMDHCTAECVKATVDAIWAGSAALPALLLTSKYNVHLTTNDQHSANLKCERMFRGEMQEKESRLRTCCAVHRTHTAQTAQWACVDRTVSGMLQLSLAMRPGGSVQALREALKIFLTVRVLVKKGLYPPDPTSPEAMHREALLDLFVGGPLTAAKAQRLAVLRRFLNGDWTSQCIEHYCPPGCCTTGDSIKEMQTELVPALIPHAAPVFNRSKWVRHEQAIDWSGLMFNCHSIGDIVPPWARELSDASKPVVPADFACVLVDGLGPRGARAPAAGPDPGAGEAQLALENTDVGTLVAVLSGADFSALMKERNKQSRQSATTFARSSPGSELIVMRIAHKPLFSILTSLLAASSEKWDRKNSVAAASGAELKLRLLEHARNPNFNEARKETARLMLSIGPWAALAPQHRTADASLLAFKLLSVGATCIEAMLCEMHKQYPFRLFLLLLRDPALTAQILEELEHDCILDEFTRDHLKRFPGSAVASEESLSCLTAALTLASGDTVRIEARHASLRRSLLRAVQTLKRSLKDVTADFFLLQERLKQTRRPGWQRDTKEKRARAKLRQRGAAFFARAAQKQKSRRREGKKVRELSTAPRNVQRRARRAAKGLETGRQGRRGASSAWKVLFGMEVKALGRLPNTEERAAIRAKYTALPLEELSALNAEARKRSLKFRSKVIRKRQRLELVDAPVAPEETGVAESAPQPQPSRLAEASSSLVVLEACAPSTMVELRRAAAADSRAKKDLEGREDRSLELACQRILQQAQSDVALVSDFRQDFCGSVAPSKFTSATAYDYKSHDVISHLLPRVTAAEMQPLRAQWRDASSYIMHRSQVRVDAAEAAGENAKNLCKTFGSCLCDPEHNSKKLMYLRLVIALKKRLFPTPRKDQKDLKERRRLLKKGDLVLRLVGERDGHELEKWYHVGWVNLTTWHMFVMELAASTDEAHRRRVAPFIPLQVADDPSQVSLMTAAFGLDPSFKWDCAVYTLVGSLAVVPDWSVRFQQVALLLPRDCFSEEPPVIGRRRLPPAGNGSRGIGSGAAPRPPRARQRTPDSSRAMEGAASQDEGCGDGPGEQAISLERLLEEALEEAGLPAEGAGDGVSDGDGGDDDDDDGAGVPVIVVERLEGPGCPGDQGDGLRPRVADDPERRPPPEAAAPREPAIGPGRPPRRRLAEAVPGDAVEPRPGGPGWAGRRAGPAYVTIEIPNFSVHLGGEPAGQIKINAAAGSLDAHCRLCKKRVNRQITKQPLGTLAAWLQCCPRSENPAATPAMHYAMLNETDLPFAYRSEVRDAAMALPECEPLVDAERGRGFDGSEPVLGAF